MLNIGEQDQDGRQKRIEHRGKHLRLSRTGGVSLRQQMRIGKFNVTGNTSRGVRVSRQVAKGTNVALQNGKLRIKGRYGKGPTKLNLSKSGVSVSTKNKIGTFNWLKPQYSSAKIFGVQVRGKKAMQIQMIFMLLQAVIFLIVIAFKLSVWLLYWAFQLCVVLPFKLIKGIFQAAGNLAGWIGDKAADARIRRKREKQKKRIQTTLHTNGISLPSFTTEQLQTALIYIILYWGSGHDTEKELKLNNHGRMGEQRSEAERPAPGRFRHGTIGAQLDTLRSSIPAEKPKPVIVGIFSLFTEQFTGQATEQQQIETFLDADELCVEAGGRTRVQVELLEILADSANIAIEPEEREEN